MVHPNVPAILFTPICPHSLSFRPVILPDYADVELKVPQDARQAPCTCLCTCLVTPLHCNCRYTSDMRDAYAVENPCL